MKTVLWLLVLVGLCASCPAKEPTTTFDAQAARSNVLAALPAGWSMISPPWQQDQFTTAYFTHPRTDAFVLLGPGTNYINWTDSQGRPHREALARECLYVWLVPGDFSPKFPRFPSEPWGGEQVFSSKAIRAYGYVSHHIADTNRMDTIIKAATMVSSPSIRISWAAWQRDIKASLKK
jgi:hypothetical protein